MEEQEILKTEIGTTESERISLKPAKVKIVNVVVTKIEKAKANKAVFQVKHPDATDNINLSAVMMIEGKEIRTIGTWINFDSENKLQKGSALAMLLNKLGAKSLNDTIGKEVETELDGKYLAFKIY